MATPKPSSSGIVVQHHEDGRLAVLVDGKPLPGLVSAQICHEHGQRAVVNIEIAGIAFRLDTSPLTSSEARVARIDEEGTATLVLAADDLTAVLLSLPQSYRILHSVQATHDETGLIGAPLNAVWKAWRIECQ